MTEEKTPTCSAVIATLDRLDSLETVLRCLTAQRVLPCELIIAAAGDAASVSQLATQIAPNFPTRVISCEDKSAARQRNRAAAEAKGEVIAFLDDDIEFGPELLEQVLAHFALPKIGAVSPRIANTDRQRPGLLTRSYFRIQAGYPHSDYGARLFGPGINCFPVFSGEPREKVAADWLPSTCLFIRASLFKDYQFPDFSGYSFAEDVYLTARVSKSANLYFLSEPSILHHSRSSEFKADLAALTASKLHNMGVIAREVQKIDGWRLWCQWNLHRLFLICILLIRRPTGWWKETRGIVSSRL